MKIEIVSPTKAYIVSATQAEKEALKKQLTYTNTSISFQMSKLAKMRWFKQNHYEKWKARYDELKDKKTVTIVYKDHQGEFIRPGIIPYIKDLSVETVSLIKYPAPTTRWNTPLPFEPYGYQNLAVKNLLAARHGAVSLCTGSGKTLCLQLLTKKLGLKTAIIVPTKGIFLEVLATFEECFGKEAVGAFGNGKKDLSKHITVCIAKSVSMVKPGTKEADFFSEIEVLIFDEAHLAAATELEKICHNVISNAPYRFFLSGTQTRGDGSTLLLQSITGPIVHTLSTKDGIEQGSLSPMEFRIISVFPEKPHYNTSDAARMKREHILYNKNVIKKAAQIANVIAEKKGENILILVEEIEQISLLIKELKVPYVYTHGNTTDIKTLEKLGLTKTNMAEVLEKFHKRIDGTMVLIGTENISIGVNTFAHHGINLQGGASEIGTKQGIIGRMVRITDKSRFAKFHPPKKIARIYDFRILPTTNDKNELVTYSLLEKHLQKRIDFYKETGGEIFYID